MNDQADRLREMVLDVPPPTGVAEENPRPLLVVSGGSAGVGTTTLTIELASDFTRHGKRRVLLVDANFSRPALATRCGRVERGTLCDVLAGRRTVNEVLLRGPDGVQIVPGGRWEGQTIEQTHGRLLDQLRRLRDSADLVIVDAGKGCGETVQLFWQVATTILLVTTPDPDAILHGYAAIKAAAKRAAPEKICVVANRVDRDRPDDGQIQQRIRQACHQFLGAAIDAGPSVPVGTFVERPGHVSSSPPLGRRNASSALKVRALAEHLTRRLGLPGRPGGLLIE
ncbi:MAG: MinD/ParA family protein [Pirellulales bacterium]